MKQFIFGSLIVLCFSMTGYAQPGSLWLGAHTGADIGTIATGPPDAFGTTTSKTGIAIGEEGDYWISYNGGISIQLSYVQKGFTANLNDGPYSITYRYLQMPVLLKVTFGTGPVKPFFFAGPEIGLKLSATQSGPIFGRDTTVDFPDSAITKFNIGILLGAGIAYMVNSAMMLFLEAGYDHGLSNITPSGKDPTVFTRDIRASLGILFRIE